MWTILKKSRAGEFVERLSLSSGLAALQTFEKTCDEGAPGEWLLRADGPDGADLATAKVEREEFSITWRRPWIFYALGREGNRFGLDEVWVWLADK